MRSKRPDGSIRERSKGYFQIRYSLGIDPLTGERKRVEASHKGTYESAKVELRRLLRSVDKNVHVDPSKTTVSEFLTQWIETMRSQVSPTTHERYSDIVKNFLIPNFGGSHLCKLVPSAIQNVYNTWETTGRKDGGKGGLSPRTRVHIHRVFKSALKHALQLQLIGRNPADAVKPPKAKKASISVLTVEQSATLLGALQGSRLYWPVLLALTTGMRRGEILALRWKNVDFETATVRVVESLERTRNSIRFKEPKTERTRAIVLPEYAAEELKAWKKKQAEELSARNIALDGNTLVCGKRDGEPLNPITLTHEFIAAIQRLSSVLPRVRFHDLRHSHATQLLTAGIHPKIAQERLGHSTITTTLDLYSHVTNTMQNDAASKLDTVFRSAIRARSNLVPKLG